MLLGRTKGSQPDSEAGDSSFFHTTMPAIANAVHHGSDILMVVLDNGATVTSGFQANPGQPRDAMGRPAPALDIERIARAIGVESAVTVGPDYLDAQLHEVFREGLSRRGLALIVVRTPCQPSDRWAVPGSSRCPRSFPCAGWLARPSTGDVALRCRSAATWSFTRHRAAGSIVPTCAAAPFRAFVRLNLTLGGLGLAGPPTSAVTE
jgi:hypothetical protein